MDQQSKVQPEVMPQVLDDFQLRRLARLGERIAESWRDATALVGETDLPELIYVQADLIRAYSVVETFLRDVGWVPPKPEGY